MSELMLKNFGKMKLNTTFVDASGGAAGGITTPFNILSSRKLFFH